MSHYPEQEKSHDSRLATKELKTLRVHLLYFQSFCSDHNDPPLTLKHKPLQDYNLQSSSTVKCVRHFILRSRSYDNNNNNNLSSSPLTFKDSQYDHLLCWSVTAHKLSLCGQLLGLELVTQPCINHLIHQTPWIPRNQWDYLCPSVSGRFLPWPFPGFTRDFLALLLNSVPFTGILDLIEKVPVLEAGQQHSALSKYY